MKLKFLGTGSAFTMTNRQSNMVLSYQNKNLLIDCGTDIRHSMDQAGMSHLDIDAVYISHLHADHAGGLEWLGFMTYFDPRYKGRPKLYISEYLYDDLWNSCLKAGMGSLEGSVATLETYFEPIVVPKNELFTWRSKSFRLVQTVHIVNGFTIEPSFGMLWSHKRKSYFFTSDTQFAPSQLTRFYEQADIIFHDCETAYHSGVHAHYDDLNRSLSGAVKKRMWLYHYNDGELPDAVQDGFAGFVNRGQEFEL